MDTGGKDGAIKDLCAALNPAGLEIRSFKAPSAEELDHDFLWRVHKATPGKGMIGLWNRSHCELLPLPRAITNCMPHALFMRTQLLV
jgi:polyphosphate kinase 2 (PPK2 family)